MTFDLIFASLDEIRENVNEFQLPQERREYLSELKKAITEFIDELEIRKAKLEEECGALEKAAQTGEPVPSLTYVYGQLFDLAADPDEVHNLWDVPQAQTTRNRLLIELQRWYAESHLKTRQWKARFR